MRDSISKKKDILCQWLNDATKLCIFSIIIDTVPDIMQDLKILLEGVAHWAGLYGGVEGYQEFRKFFF